MSEGFSAAHAAGPVVSSGSRVVLVVSRGPRPGPATGTNPVPTLVDVAQGDALELLEKALLNAQVFHDSNDSVRHGHVIDQFPPPGAVVDVDSQVVVLVSDGPGEKGRQTALPDIVGLAEIPATTAVRAAGLEPEIVHDYHRNVAEGIVMAQLPAQATIAAEKPLRPARTWLWVALAIVLLAIVGIAAFFLISGRQTTVPNVTGQTQTQAEQTLAAAGLKTGSVTVQSGTDAPGGSVIAQTPQPQAKARAGSKVNLTVAAARPAVTVPNVVGLSASSAQSSLAGVGLAAELAYSLSDSVPLGNVIDQRPPAGQSVEPPAAVTISVSLGTQSTAVTVPNTVGLTQAAATAKVASVPLTSLITFAYSPSVPVGEVIDQAPLAGQQVNSGTTVGLNISAGPAPSNYVTVPSITNRSQPDAINALGALGLTYTTAAWDGTAQPAGTIVSQLPRAGELVPSGSTVVVFVSSGK